MGKSEHSLNGFHTTYSSIAVEVFSDISLLVVVKLTSSDRREYQVTFPTQSLHRDSDTRFLLSFSNLQSTSNGLQLYVNCELAGKDNTEVPIREALLGNQRIVSLSFGYLQTRRGLMLALYLHYLVTFYVSSMTVIFHSKCMQAKLIKAKKICHCTIAQSPWLHRVFSCMLSDRVILQNDLA